jgi:hypothetical protein
MELTLSVIKADVGGYVGHSSSHPDVIQKAKEKLEHAQGQGLLIGCHVTVCGDDLQLIMTHQQGEDSERIHKLAWATFVEYTNVAKSLKLHGAGQDLLIVPDMHSGFTFRKVIKIFIASPRDLNFERTRFPDIISEVNRIKANPQGIQLEPLGWEDTLPGKGRPQEKINEDIKKCDLIVMLLGKHWGTSTGKYTSGFEEEYELAKSLSEKTNGKPEIWLYFRAIPYELLAEPDEQLRQVVDFRSKIKREKQFFPRAYKGVHEWERLFRDHLCQWLDSQPLVTFQLGKSLKYEERVSRLEKEFKRLRSSKLTR